MPQVEYRPTRCAICRTEGEADELYPANISAEAFTPEVFSARRLPDRLHYRLTRCRKCGLTRSDPVAAPELIAALYAASGFTYGDEAAALRATYGRYLRRLARYSARKGILLEVGCGSGFFLEEALAQGYREARGAEPSAAAAAMADARVRSFISVAAMHRGLFAPESFDVVCLFQVIDHAPDPADLLEACREALKPGGLLLAISHNARSWSARLLGERSPIVDVEHTYLFDRRTISRLLETRGFEVLRVGTAWNSYSLSYLARLAPLPPRLKRPLMGALRATRLGRLPLRAPLGNFLAIARKSCE